MILRFTATFVRFERVFCNFLELFFRFLEEQTVYVKQHINEPLLNLKIQITQNPRYGQNGSTTATFPFITSDNAVRNYGLSVHSLVATTLKFIPIIIREGLLKKDLQDAFSKIFCVSVTILLNDLNGNFSKTDLEEDGHIN